MARSDMLHAPYGEYLGLEQLFALQGEITSLTHPDEFQFRTVHLVSELWLRFVATEMERTTAALREQQWTLVTRLLQRCNATLNLLVAQLGLLETMTRADYNAFRGALGEASGLQSPGYQLIRREAKALYAAFAAAREPSSDDEGLHYTAELLLSLDMALNRFLTGHLQIARRFIGDGGAGTGGQGVDYLRGGVERALFPELWKAAR